MDERTRQDLLYACAAGICAFAVARLFRKKGKKYWVYPDHDLHNSKTADVRESPNAAVDHAEIGLSELDSAYRSEWVSMGYPQTYHELDYDSEKWKK